MGSPEAQATFLAKSNDWADAASCTQNAAPKAPAPASRRRLNVKAYQIFRLSTMHRPRKSYLQLVPQEQPPSPARFAQQLT